MIYMLGMIAIIILNAVVFIVLFSFVRQWIRSSDKRQFFSNTGLILFILHSLVLWKYGWEGGAGIVMILDLPSGIFPALLVSPITAVIEDTQKEIFILTASQFIFGGLQWYWTGFQLSKAVQRRLPKS